MGGRVWLASPRSAMMGAGLGYAEEKCLGSKWVYILEPLHPNHRVLGDRGVDVWLSVLQPGNQQRIQLTHKLHRRKLFLSSLLYKVE